MPATCNVIGDIPCPSCHQPLLEAVNIQWGVVPYNEYYHLGDRVRWMREQDGRVVEPFVYRKDQTGRRRWNCGGPEYPNVIVFDWYLALRAAKVVCPNCRTRIHEAIAVVQDGIFREVRALDAAGADALLGDSAGKTKIIIVREDGTYLPREDWFDAGLKIVEGDTVEIA